MLNILQLTKKFPSPLIDGEILAIYNLGRSLVQCGCQVSVLSMNTTRHLATTINEKDLEHYHQVQSVKVDNRIRVLDAFVNLFSRRSYHIQRFISEAYKEALIHLLKENDYDLIQLETVYLAPYVDTIRTHSKAKIVLRSHNIEHEIWKRITDNTTLLPKRLYLSLLTKRLKAFELNTLNAFDMVVPVTHRDLSFFLRVGMKRPSFVAPIGLDFNNYPMEESVPNPVNDASLIHFCFIGSLDWMPNIEGLDWLLTHVWPEIAARHANARFHIAGRNAPDRILRCNMPGVVVHGEVEDAKQFIQQSYVMLVPLFSGSGMRVKILEGMALGKVVISTSIGLEGIDASDQSEVLLANDIAAFHKQISFCMDQPDQIQRIGQKARSYIQEHFDTHRIAERLIVAYKQLV